MQFVYRLNSLWNNSNVGMIELDSVCMVVVVGGVEIEREGKRLW